MWSVSGRFAEAVVGQQEEDERALDRALLGGRVEHRDLFLGFDFAAEREGVEAFARQRVVGLLSSASVIVSVGAASAVSSLSFWTSKKTPK